jgi:hypothetical protein
MLRGGSGHGQLLGDLHAGVAAADYPNSAAVASHQYGSLEEQFTYRLDRLLDGLGIAG